MFNYLSLVTLFKFIPALKYPIHLGLLPLKLCNKYIPYIPITSTVFTVCIFHIISIRFATIAYLLLIRLISSFDQTILSTFPQNTVKEDLETETNLCKNCL
jgi:predicted ABC-type exoprotein transport system permease subunit